MTLAFQVFGVAQPKGSHRAFQAPGMRFPIVTDSNRNLKSWAQLVSHAAHEALGRLPPSERAVLRGPVRVAIAFYLPRPKKYGKRGVYVEHLTAPDIDKLLRGVLDALTAVVYGDDSQVVCLEAVKRYAALEDAPHCDVWVGAMATPVVVPLDQPALFEALR